MVKVLHPSAGLMEALVFGHDRNRWSEFHTRYFEELCATMPQSII